MPLNKTAAAALVLACALLGAARAQAAPFAAIPRPLAPAVQAALDAAVIDYQSAHLQPALDRVPRLLSLRPRCFPEEATHGRPRGSWAHAT